MRPLPALAFVLCLLAAGSAMPCQVVVEEVGVFQDQLHRASACAEAQDWAKATHLLDPLIADLTRWENEDHLQPSDREILLRALELRGASRISQRDAPGAREDFAHLLSLRPEWAVEPGRPIKARKLFEEVRRSLTGTVTLSVDPGDAALSVDGRDLGTSYPRVLPLLKGRHRLRWTRSGYDPASREVDVVPGADASLDIRLSANAKTVYFLVQPQGTRLTLGKKLIATADAPASSREEFAQLCRENSVDPAATFIIAAVNLPPGDQRVALERECHEPKEFVVKVSVDPGRSVPGFTKPVILQRRTVAFGVISTPSGATLSVDGKVLGPSPMDIPDLCVGEHEFHLSKSGVGEYRTRLTVTATGPLSLHATLRPTLLWVGLTRDQETGADLAKAYDQALRTELGRMIRFNATFSAESNPLLPDTLFGEGISDEERMTSVESLCEAYGAQGALVGRVSRKQGRARLDLRLFLPSVMGFDAFESDLKSPMEAGEALVRVDADPAPPTAGGVARAADLPGYGAPVVVRGSGDPSGPALGDLILTVGGKPVSGAAEVRSLLAEAPGRDVVFRRGEQEISWKSPAELVEPVVAYGGPTAGTRRTLLLSRQAALSARGLGAATAAAMNLACAWLNLGRPGSALSALAGLDPAGVPPDRAAALAYLKAVALVHLGRGEDARALAATAAADASASLDGLGDLPLQPLARDLLAQLPAPPVVKIPLPGE